MAVKKYHIFSKMAADVTYNDYQNNGELQIPTLLHAVTVKGGAGVITKNLITPLGIHTEVDERDMEFLNRNGIFKLHKDNGFVSVQAKNADVEKVVADMTAESDPSAPLTPNDFAKGDGKKSVKLMKKD